MARLVQFLFDDVGPGMSRHGMVEGNLFRTVGETGMTVWKVEKVVSGDAVVAVEYYVPDFRVTATLWLN